MRKLFCILFIFSSSCFSIHAQEFISEVTINAEQTGQPNLSIFTTLKNSLQEFINNTKWTENEYLPQEKIPCNFFINVVEYDNNNRFKATIQIQASRPVYGSGYKTTIANFNDENFNFEYQEYQPLVYNENGDQGNLVSVITYYLFTVLAIEADTLKESGGTEYFQKAKQIVNIAQASGSAGWLSSSGSTSRYRWNDDMISGIFDDYRKAIYKYHLKGLDTMSENTKDAKKNIIEALNLLKKVNKSRPNSYVLKTFFDSKSAEISKILSGGPKMDISKTKEMLRTIAPIYSKDWDAIKL